MPYPSLDDMGVKDVLNPPSFSPNDLLKNPLPNDVKIPLADQAPAPVSPPPASSAQEASASESGSGGPEPQFTETVDSDWVKKKDSPPDPTVVFGLPPIFLIGDVDPKITAFFTSHLKILEILPAFPEYGGITNTQGSELFSLNLEEGRKNFEKLLKPLQDKNLINPFSVIYPIQFSIIHDSPIVDTWSTSFGESQFESKINIGSSFMQELRLVTGSNDLSGLAQLLPNSIGGGKEGPIANIVGEIENAIKGTKLERFKNILTGSRVDFPQVWQGSSHTTSYEVFIKLFCPDPSDTDLFRNYIVTPISYLLCLSCPISTDLYTYNFPMLVKAKCGGLFNVPAGYISNLSIMKGGEDNVINVDQRPSSVDIRFSLTTLYSTMIACTEDNTNIDKDTERPTVRKYIETFYLKTERADLEEQKEEQESVEEKSIPSAPSIPDPEAVPAAKLALKYEDPTKLFESPMNDLPLSQDMGAVLNPDSALNPGNLTSSLNTSFAGASSLQNMSSSISSLGGDAMGNISNLAGGATEKLGSITSNLTPSLDSIGNPMEKISSLTPGLDNLSSPIAAASNALTGSVAGEIGLTGILSGAIPDLTEVSSDISDISKNIDSVKENITSNVTNKINEVTQSLNEVTNIPNVISPEANNKIDEIKSLASASSSELSSFKNTYESFKDRIGNYL